AVGTVDSGASTTLAIQARVTVVAPQSNVVTVTHSDQFDPDPNNNRAAATVDAAQSDLAVTKTPSTRLVAVGQTMFFTIDVSNLGPDTATNVVVTDRLPSGLTFVGVSQISQGTYDRATGRWSVGTLALGATARLRIQVRVTSAGSIANSVTATLDEFDPMLRNNLARVSILSRIPGKGGLLAN
ncbi:MAG TPA: DUF11 domain-containing protein, partial [Gemmataceae bacterium]|nr:DUF11 domain-containing protein [Gemmataceae bacterium]